MPKRYGGFVSHRTMLDISVEIGRAADRRPGHSQTYGTERHCFHGFAPGPGRVWAEDGSVCTASSFPAKGAKVKKVDGGLVADGVWACVRRRLGGLEQHAGICSKRKAVLRITWRWSQNPITE